MTEIAKFVVAVAVLLPCQEVAAQAFKCTDAAGKISYTSAKCSDLGLKDAGEVRDLLNVNPGQPPAGAVGLPPSRASAGKAENTEKPAAAPEPAADPDRRCFTVKTAKGNVTRCNDKPDD